MIKEKIYPASKSFPALAGQMYCPGCHHSMAGKVLCEVLGEMDIAGRCIMVSGVGCYTSLGGQIGTDNVMLSHGPSPAVATAIKRCVGKETIVFTVQGDGDCAAIGAGFLIGAASRADKITIIMLNNGMFSMTGGQLAPTTLMGQETTTTPEKRDPDFGYPLHVPEMLATIKGVAYCARGSFSTLANYRRTKGYLKTAFQKQIDDVGLSFLEILTTCPVGWRMTPVEAVERVDKVIVQEYPLGEFKNVDKIG